MPSRNVCPRAAAACVVALACLPLLTPNVLFGIPGPLAPRFGVSNIVAENALPGNPASEWDITGAGDPSIQGFATDISVDQGDPIEFKIDTDATDYRIEIYRLGWYAGDGARHIVTLEPSAALPQSQPACLTDPATGLTDCGNWTVSATWPVPEDATSGLYIAKLVREDPDDGRASHVVFVVRDDDGGSDLLFQTSDTTWQAYNAYGGNSLYVGGSTTPPVLRASKVSYNRPFVTRGGPVEDWLFNAEYPMIRWLEANGFDVSYSTDVDTDRRGAELLEHRAFLSIGHDEYWSAGQRAAVEAARDAGVHLGFFSGNECYWKTRWEPSIDGSGTSFRTLVCYKEGTLGEINCGGKCDPLPDTWTGLWRDGCTFSPPADGCRPENALTGQISWFGSVTAIDVPGAFAPLRFWRHTSIATLLPHQSVTLADNTLGYEWDYEQFPSHYPLGRIGYSETLESGRTHRLSLYRHASGALVFGAGTVQWSWGLDGTHDRGASTPDLRMQQATVNLLTEMGATAATPQPGLVAVTATGDVAPPTTAIGFPVEGATVQQQVAVSVSGTAVETGGGTVASVLVSVDGGTTWARATGGASWTYTWIPQSTGAATIRARAVDDWGNLETTGPEVAVLVDPAPPPVCPCSLWNSGPAGTDENDPTPVEVGLRFRSDVDASVAGVRFFKHAASVGTHIGNLWTNGGTPLATATFSGESASGWQDVQFDPPVAITAGTTYVASVYLPSGHYSSTIGAFATAGVDAPPLHALGDGIDGANGIYRYGPTSGFPTDTYNSTNYWVDVVLATAAVADTTAPIVVGIAPGNGAVGIPAGSNVTVTFSEPIDPGTLDASTIELLDASLAPVATTVSWSLASRTATLDPVALLAYSTVYTMRVHGGPTPPRVADPAGNALPADVTWTFTTSAPPPPPPDEGPGGPILVIAHAADPFSRYYAEILRCEGLNAFTVTDLTLVTPLVLAAHDVVILAAGALDAGQVTMLTQWVDAGGNLIAMRPDLGLASLLGLAPAGGTLADAYLRVETSSGPGAGIVAATMQFHGAADRYTASDATPVAVLYSNATTATPHLAATLRSVGTQGGAAACFTYDLARSIVWTRQGNPAWVGQERDGIAPRRSDDLFYGAAAFDPQPDWVDLDKVAIPQADEQQRLLANLILTMNGDRKPLPRFWYLPRGLKAAVVMTGDDHGSSGMVPRFDTYIAQSPSGCSVGDWECVRASGYLYVTPPFTSAQALAYHNLGFEIGVHVNTGCSDWTAASLPPIYDAQLASFAATYPDIPIAKTNRTHCIAWSEWATQAKVELEHGIRLDTNYYYWPAGWVQNRPGMFTGSGMPMRFADVDGSLIDCYQVATQMTDESGQTYPFTSDTLLDRALGPEGYYGAFCANMHFDSAPHGGSDAIVASALARDVPVVSAQQMLDWIDGRNSSTFDDFTWNGSTLGFTLAVGAGASNLRGMLPVRVAVGELVGLTRDAISMPWTTDVIKGIEYAFFEAGPGAYAATYLPDLAPPLITNVTAVPAPAGTGATITWTTDEPATSRVDWGTSPGTLGENASAGALVTAHEIVIGGLVPGTTVYFRVTSADAALQSATSPAPPAAPASFTTPATPSAPCAVDDLYAEFGAGDASGGTYVANEVDGEVILAPAVGSEFEGGALPAGWTHTPWGGGGQATVAGGAVTVDGTRLGPGASFGPGSSLEFVATFGAQSFQHVGFTDDFASTWLIFSTGNTSTTLFARTNPGTDTAIPGSWIGAPHRFRIDWNPTNIVYSIDGAVVATHTFTIGTSLQPLLSDFATGGPAVACSWLRVALYASAGTFRSRVFDAGGTTTWGVVTWTAATPAGTSLAMLARTGGTPVPDGTWTSFVSVPVSGTSLGAAGRYLQLRADLATSNSGVTPVLEDIAVECMSTPDESPPILTDLEATPAPSGTSATITWNTNELADSHVDYGTSPLLLDQSATSASLVLAHSIPISGLVPGTTIWYRATSADAAANAATLPDPPAAPQSFTTPVPPCFVDATTADFEAGVPGLGIAITATADGEVSLAPAASAEFGGTALTPDWSAVAWSAGGTATVAGGTLTLDGARVASVPPPGFGPGRSLEFRATFQAAPFQHIALAGGGDSGPGEIFDSFPWAMFSTGSTGAALQARTWSGGAPSDVTIPGAWLGTSHVYRIDWTPAGFDYFIDGALVHASPIAIATSMRPAMSDFTVGGATLVVDWIRLGPYAASGTFESRIFDAGVAASWGAATWASDEPAGTAIAIAARTGPGPLPDGSWTGWVPLATSGTSIGTTARFIQYRAALSSTDPARTPVLHHWSAACALCSDTTPPLPLAGLVATRTTTGNDTDGTVKIDLAWAPVESGARVQIYRKGYGNYPWYDDAPGAGAEPPAPVTPADAVLAAWQPVAVVTGNATTYVDEPAMRDTWYYAAFVDDACGNVSAVSNRTSGTLNYHLGDVTNGAAACTGDNRVQTNDVSFLGAHYGATLVAADPLGCLDVGPTAGTTVDGRPLTDRMLDFEDLILFAIHHGQVAKPPVVATRPVGVDEVLLFVPAAVESDGTLAVRLGLRGSGRVQGLSVRLAWDATAVEPLGMESGSWLEELDGVALSPAAGSVDVALLGARATGFAGEGHLATVRFRILAPHATGIRLQAVEARDAANLHVDVQERTDLDPASGVPRATQLFANVPNPFNPTTRIRFALAVEGPVELAIFGVDGRKVRTLVAARRPPGRYEAEWNGTDDRGTRVSSGTYYVRLRAPDGQHARSIVLLK